MNNEKLIDFTNFLYFKVDLSNIDDLNNFMLSMLLNQKNIERLGIKKYEHNLNKWLVCYFKIYGFDSEPKEKVQEQAEAIITLLTKKHFASAIVKKLPELISV